MFISRVLVFILGVVAPNVRAQVSPAEHFKLVDLTEFRPQAGNWRVVGDVVMDPESDAWRAASKRISSATTAGRMPAAPKGIELRSGTGVLINLNDARKSDNLLTVMEHGDIELDLEVMVPKGSNSGIYLQGRYEVQIFDSLGVKRPSFDDIGGIYRNWETEAGKIYLGKAPLFNAAKAPGLWQKLAISFRAPRFDADGRKIANAKFVSVDLNGVRIHENIEVPLPTGGPVDNTECARGPLMIQGDHGLVALRTIRFRSPAPATVPSRGSGEAQTTGAVFVDVGDAPRLHRSFYDYRGRDSAQLLAHAISVGDPRGIHYVYDMNDGNLVALWRGPFIDASQMWIDRGNGFSTPRGAVQLMFNNQPLSILGSANEPFPVIANDALQARHGYQTRGYGLDKQGRPTFRYSYRGMDVEDRLTPSEDGTLLTHEVTIRKRVNEPGLHYKLAQGRMIRPIKPGWYVIDGESYVNVATGKPLIRTVGGWEELIVPMGDSLKYSILW